MISIRLRQTLVACYRTSLQGSWSLAGQQALNADSLWIIKQIFPSRENPILKLRMYHLNALSQSFIFVPRPKSVTIWIYWSVMTGVIEIYWAWQNVSSLFEWLVWAAFYVFPPKLLMTTGHIGLWIKYCVAFIVIEGVAGSGGWKRGVVERPEIQWSDKFDVLHSGSEIRNKESSNFLLFSKVTSGLT